MPIRLAIQQSTGEGDAEANPDGSLVDDDGIETSVTISLHTDAKATAEELARYGKSQRGYWADAYDDESGVLNTGSKLWLLEGALLTDETLATAQAYADEALAWMVEEGIASAVDTTVTRLGEQAVAGTTRITIPRDPRSPYLVTWERYFALQ